MIIKKKRINNIDKILSLIGDQDFYISATCGKDTLTKLGFKKYEVGSSIVPSIIGPASKTNCKGKEIVDKSEKETVVHSIPYDIKDWHGNPHSGFYDREFTRWKRVYVQALNERIEITSKDGDYYKVSTRLLSPIEAREKLKHILNLMLEINSEVEILDLNNEGIMGTKKVSWRIIPPGEMPWDVYYDQIKEKMSSYNREEIKSVKERYEFLKSLKPNNIICGNDGFSGYFIAEFNNNQYVCDSIFIGNALYILDDDWEQVSKLTKKEIINNSLAKERIIHTGDWKKRVIKNLRK